MAWSPTDPVKMSVDQKREEASGELLALLKEAKLYVAKGVANKITTTKEGRDKAGKLFVRIDDIIKKIEGN